LEKAQKFFEAFGDFTQPAQEQWALLSRITDVRNVIIHNNVCMDGCRNSKRLMQFVKGCPISSKSMGLSK
jgi:hypothetical protein